ncbi:universal stress family protein [Desulfitobacterium dichloroeliminans LMG P-21439]|uniref:Universal stress family protein n=1 Tax=Desulfitobacterium dichloroeliminans (strain LMG P-21439 / DCA1) TaxID=871963 RepID=L0F3E4_DESDL|nr:universal stress family protein [Desulfitobacterium dichloroeliminans]AGA67697.1 universal stress family protein [Desulfitobacterium dichloroeliminans LMG P-21439]
MKTTRTRMDEGILVCVYYGPNGERLIRRGCKIASMLDCPLYILTVDPLPFEEFDAERSDYINRWKQLAKEYNAEEYIIRDNEKRPVTKVIAEVARESNITQIILGQTAQNRWQEITKGSIINVLLREIPFIDLHIISEARAIVDQEGYFQKGVRAYLIQEGEKYRLSFDYSKDITYEGIFFKETGTDFNNGVFRFINEQGTIQVHVTDDYAHSMQNVTITGPGSESEIWDKE